MPTTDGTWVTFEIHFGRNPSRTKQNQRRQAVENPGQPLPALVGIDHDETEMGDLRRLAIEFDIHHRQRVEGNRASGRFLGDQRDDGARQPFTVAGENAVGEAFLGQRFGGHDAQLRDQFAEFGFGKRQAREIRRCA